MSDVFIAYFYIRAVACQFGKKDFIDAGFDRETVAGKDDVRKIFLQAVAQGFAVFGDEKTDRLRSGRMEGVRAFVDERDDPVPGDGKIIGVFRQDDVVDVIETQVIDLFAA